MPALTPERELTLRDVAAEAGLSVTTVSLVLNGKAEERRIALRTRRRVQEAADRLGFRINGHARALRTGRSRLIGLIGEHLNLPIMQQRVHSAAQAILERGYDVAFHDLAWEVGRQARALHDLDARRAQAVLVVTDYSPERIAAFNRLLRRRVPLAAFSEDCPLDADTVQTDREEGAYLATRHLLALGHRRITLAVHADSRAASIRQRIQGYRRAHREAGATVDDSLILSPTRAAASFAEGVEVVPRVLQHPARPTALFCQNDQMAIGALQALNRAGARVPDDIAVVGFDGLEEAAYSIPPLTTVVQPLAEVARMAVNLLVDRLERPDERLAPRHVVVKPALVVRRESCHRGSH